MMHSRTRSWGVWILVTFAVLLAAFYAALVHDLIDDEPSLLRSCTITESHWLAWTCKQVLYRKEWSPDHVNILNKSAGARLAFSDRVPKDALELEQEEQYLLLFLARGVDINAIDIRNKNWTALHGAAVGSHLHEAQLLLKHGANKDLRDVQGLTALDIALRVQEKEPNNPKAVEMVRLLRTDHAASAAK